MIKDSYIVLIDELQDVYQPDYVILLTTPKQKVTNNIGTLMSNNEQRSLYNG